MLKDFKHVTV